MKILLITLIAICQVFITIIPSKFKLSDNRRKFPRDFTWTGWGLIMLCTMTMVSSVWLFIISDNEQTKSQLQLDAKLKLRDSIHEVSIKKLSEKYSIKVDSSYKKSEETFLTIITKYGLHYDSVSKRLENKIDTTKVEIQPDLSLRNNQGIVLDSIKNDTYFLTIFTQSKNAVSRNINVKIYAIVLDSNSNLTLIPNQIRPFGLDRVVSKDQWGGLSVRFKALSSVREIYIYLKGTYTNFAGNITHKVDAFYSYNISDKINPFGAPNDEYEEKLRNFLKYKKLP